MARLYPFGSLAREGGRHGEAVLVWLPGAGRGTTWRGRTRLALRRGKGDDMARPCSPDLAPAAGEGQAGQRIARADSGDRQMPDMERANTAGVIVGQAVSRDKLERAKSLRRASTRAERMLWQCLRADQLQGLHFRRQQVLDGLILDFYCHSARLAIEVDGGVHEGQMEYDEERERVLALRGIRVLRVRNEQVEASLSSVLALILEATKGASVLGVDSTPPHPGWEGPIGDETRPHPDPLPEGEGRDGQSSPLPAWGQGRDGRMSTLPESGAKAGSQSSPLPAWGEGRDGRMFTLPISCTEAGGQSFPLPAWGEGRDGRMSTLPESGAKAGSQSFPHGHQAKGCKQPTEQPEAMLSTTESRLPTWTKRRPGASTGLSEPTSTSSGRDPSVKSALNTPSKLARTSALTLSLMRMRGLG